MEGNGRSLRVGMVSLFRHSLGGTEENYENLRQNSWSSGRDRIQRRGNHSAATFGYYY
jgi:hypothetical protein